MYNEYLSNQLKSVWLVLNDMKRTLDEVTDHIGLNSSREMLWATYFFDPIHFYFM